MPSIKSPYEYLPLKPVFNPFSLDNTFKFRLNWYYASVQNILEKKTLL
jgi:hypothetical protein